MKKIISLILAVLVLLSLTSFVCAADEVNLLSTISFSNDYQRLYVGNEEYVAFDSSNIYTDMSYEFKTSIALSYEQREVVKEINLSASDNGLLIDAKIKYISGMSVSLSYIKSNYLNEINTLKEADNTEHKIDFYFPNNNIVYLSKDKLMGEKVILNDPSYHTFFDVTISTSGGEIEVYEGLLLLDDVDNIYGNTFYYLDYSEIGTTAADFELYDIDSVEVYRITDAEAVELLKAAQDSYYSNDFGFFLDDTFTKSVADAFLIILFGVFPLSILVLFLIFGIRAKGLYKKLCFTVSALSLAEIIVFVSLIILL